MRNTIFRCFVFVMTAAGCQTTDNDKGNVLLNTPGSGTDAIRQGGGVVPNHCNAGGHTGRTTGAGWVFDAREGCYLNCKSVDALKQDYLGQLHTHRIYGDFDKLAAKDPESAELARFFTAQQTAKGLQLQRFDKLTAAQLFDGAKWQDLGLKPGDLLLNMNFGQPNHAGIFYSKRGIAHARLVVDVQPNTITTFDGGWQKFSTLTEINSQAVWIRPRPTRTQKKDMENLVKWAKAMESAPYDNALVDDWKDFRIALNAHLDKGLTPAKARLAAFSAVAKAGKAPGNFDASFSYSPPSGLYCSEGSAAIYSYLGVRQYGETAIDIMTAFSRDGSLPDWQLYEDALSGFGADSEESIYMMHKLFYDYFRAFETGRQLGVIQIPGIPDAKAMTFAEAAAANLKAAGADAGASNHLNAQLEALEAATAGSETESPTPVQMLRGGLEQARAALSERVGQELNLSQAVYTLFYDNLAYGPHTFLENGKAFELKGVFYNSNLQGNQALFISDWWLETFGKPKLEANIQTTLYRIVDDPSLPDDRCVVAEPAPLIFTH